MHNISVTQRFYNFLASPYFFGLVVLFFIAQAVWIALSGIYPMAFDEDFHLGIIKIYAESNSPFLVAHPPGADIYGAITRDPSYLYHYLMSFLYRLISALTDNQATQIISLRFINIAIFTTSLFIWRSVLLKVKASPAIIHLCLLIFILLPIVPFLAAHINYDNVFVPAVALVFLYASRLAISIRTNKSIQSKDALILLALCTATSLIKYAFLPIFIAVVAFFAVILYRNRKSRTQLSKSFINSWRVLSIASRVLLVGSVVVIGTLFAERYAVNLVRYHEPVPDCSKVLTVEKCKQYGPWGRDYAIAARKPANATTNPIAFSYDWITGMWLRTFFAVGGQTTEFDTKGPLLVPASLTIILAVFSIFSSGFYFKNIWRRYNKPVIALFLTIIAVYIFLLWVDRYQSFIKLGQTVALNGRYLIPILLPIMLLGALGVNEVFKRNTTFKLYFASIVVIGFLLGGGALTFILRSNEAWLWNINAIKNSNQQIRESIGPIIPGNNNPGLFMSQN